LKQFCAGLGIVGGRVVALHGLDGGEWIEFCVEADVRRPKFFPFDLRLVTSSPTPINGIRGRSRFKFSAKRGR
jgi:hypothetical protein